jgi:ATP-binding cassette, subfamily C, bacterial EexD
MRNVKALDLIQPLAVASVVAKCKSALWSAGLLSMVINVLMLVPVIYMMQIYDRVLASASVPTLVSLSLIALLLLILSGFLEWVRSHLMLIVAGRLESSLSDYVHRQLFPDTSKQVHADVPGNLRHELQVVRQFVSGPGAIALFDAPWVLIYITGLFFLNFWLGVLGLGCTVVLLTLAALNEKLNFNLVGKAGETSQIAAKALTQHLQNRDYIIASGLAERLRKMWVHLNANAIDLQHKAQTRTSAIAALSRVFRVISQSAILGLGAYLAIYKEVSPGAVLAGSVLLGRALAPVDLAIAHSRNLLQARASYQRLKVALGAAELDETRVLLPKPKGEIVVADLSVIPPGLTKPVVNELSFEIPAGTLLAIVGPSASGKSTLMRSMLGVYPAAQGSIRFDGADISQYTTQQLSKWVGYLPQDVEILDGSVGQNICGFTDAASEDIIAAARLAQVHEMILQLPHGYSTLVGSGPNLSAGQKQRLALARAVFGKPAIVVLDEPNSNLDEAGEAALLAALALLKQDGITVICVTHRRNLVQHADRVLLMVNGRRGMFGTRDQFQGALNQANPQPRGDVRGGEKK